MDSSVASTSRIPDTSTTFEVSTQTFNETLDFDDVKIDFYASMTFTIISLVFICYVIISMTYFSWRKNLCLCSRGHSINQNDNDKNRRNGAILSELILLSALSLLVYMIIELPLFWGVERPFCHTYHEVKIICTAAGLFGVYFALWYRVYTVFYQNPLLSNSASRAARVINKLTVPLLICMTVVNAVVFLTSPLYETTPIGCKKIQSKKGAAVKWSLLVSTTVSFQALLLYSLIYPLNLHRKKMLSRGVEVKSIVPLLKRAAITAGICIFSDTVNCLYALGNKQTIVYVRHIVYGSNMLINFMALIFSFADWRERLFPCAVKVKSVPSVKGSVSRKSTKTLSLA